MVDLNLLMTNLRWIMMSKYSERLERNSELRNYLAQLGELIGHEVTADQIGSLKDVEKLRAKASEIKHCPKMIEVIPPEDLKSARFASLVQRLEALNSKPVSIWLSATSSCGVFYIPKVSEFNFGFNFSEIPEGVVALLTEDGKDKLLLDFDSKEVELELQGEMWGSVDY